MGKQKTRVHKASSLCLSTFKKLWTYNVLPIFFRLQNMAFFFLIKVKAHNIKLSYHHLLLPYIYSFNFSCEILVSSQQRIWSNRNDRVWTMGESDLRPQQRERSGLNWFRGREVVRQLPWKELGSYWTVITAEKQGVEWRGFCKKWMQDQILAQPSSGHITLEEVFISLDCHFLKRGGSHLPELWIKDPCEAGEPHKQCFCFSLSALT